MSDNLLGNMLVKILGDKSDLYRALDDSEKTANRTARNITGNLKSQFKELDTVLGGVGSRMANLLSNPLVLAAASVVALGKAFGDATKALVAYGSAINDTAEQTGLSTDALQEYKFAAEQTGATLDTITSAVKIMTKGLDTNAETYAKLGVAVKDANGQFRSASDIFDDTVAALGGITNETERSKLALELFGRDAQKLIPIINLGASGLAELKDQARSLGLVMSEQTIKAADELGDKTDALAQSWKAFSMNLASGVIPTILGVENALIDTMRILQSWDQAAKDVKITKLYQEGKASVVEYHDALKRLIDYNQGVANSETTTAKNRELALKAVQDAYRELDRIKKDYGKAKEPEERAAAEAAASQANAAALAAEKARLDALRAARDTATKEYQESIKLTGQLEAAGLRTTEQAQKELTDATAKYAETLVPIVEASGAYKIGAQSLAEALARLKELTDTSTESNRKAAEARWQYLDTQGQAILNAQKETVAYEQLSLALEVDHNGQKFYTKEMKESAEQTQSVTDKLDAYAASLVRAEERQASYASIARTGFEGIASSVVSFNAAIMAGENPVKAFFKTLINTIGDGVIAFAGLAEAEAWATWPIVDWARALKGAGLLILGGTIKAAAASLAQGGIADQPTLAVVGDNPRASEMVAPLTPETFRSFADGLLYALAERSRPAGVTEATVAAASMTGSSSAGGSLHLHVGTLIADDAGMRKLNRELRKFGLQENVRTGYGG